MDKIVVSMEGRGNFMPGEAYVALSRVRTLQGLFLLGFNESAIRVNNAVTVEMERLRKRPLQLTTAPPVTVGTDVKINFLNVRSYRKHLVDLKTDETITSCVVFCFVETFLQNGQPLNPRTPSTPGRFVLPGRPTSYNGEMRWSHGRVSEGVQSKTTAASSADSWACRCDTEEGYCPHQHGRNLSTSNSPNAIATVMLGEVGKISPCKSAGGDTGGLQHRHLPEFSTHNHQPDGRSRISPTRDRTHYRQRLSPGPRVHQQNVSSLC